MTTRIAIVAGEASGDLHAARLVTALKSARGDFEFFGFGGEQMASAGVELWENLVERSVMGLTQVILEMRYLLYVAARFLDELARTRPDLVIFVDYPGLNLNLARMAKAAGIPVVYYICPQVWAWAPWRVKRIASRADLLLVILPFEEAIYRRYHERVHFVGNPVFDHLADVERAAAADLGVGDRPVVALCPGSRRQEVAKSLPIMLRAARELVAKRDDLAVIVSCQRPRLHDTIAPLVDEWGGPATIREGGVHDLQRQAYLSLVVSGTATLEQAYFGQPFVVVYPIAKWERAAFRVFSVTPHIALVNLFAGRALVPEFLLAPGEEPEFIERALTLLDDAPRDELTRGLERLKRARFEPGGAERAAQRILEFLD